MSMSDTVRGAPKQVVLSLHGDLDVATVEAIAGAVDQVIGEAAVSLVLDFAEVTFMDSQGVNALMVARQRLDEAGATLIVRTPSPKIVRVLEITGVLALLTVES